MRGSAYMTKDKYDQRAESFYRFQLPEVPDVRVKFQVVNQPTIVGPYPIFDQDSWPTGASEYWAGDGDPVQVEILEEYTLKH